MDTISALNSISGHIVSITEGALDAVVRVCISDEVFLESHLLLDAVYGLDLEVGRRVYAVFRESSVEICRSLLTSRNSFSGTVYAIQSGAVCGLVTIECATGDRVTACISNEDVAMHGLTLGCTCFCTSAPSM